jgi:hypothetical protein
MPEHVHLLFSEPERGNPSLVLAALKQTFAHRLLDELRAQSGAQANAPWSTPVAVGHVWQRRFYDFVVFTENKRVGKAALHAPQSCAARFSSGAPTVVVEQLSPLRLWRTRPSSGGARYPQNLLIPIGIAAHP